MDLKKDFISAKERVGNQSNYEWIELLAWTLILLVLVYYNLIVLTDQLA